MTEQTPVYTHSDEEAAKDERVKAILLRYDQQIMSLNNQINALQKGWGSHQHNFQYQLNANHGAIRGCTKCGATWATLVQGDPRQLEWHIIREPEEQEEEMQEVSE